MAEQKIDCCSNILTQIYKYLIKIDDFMQDQNNNMEMQQDQKPLFEWIYQIVKEGIHQNANDPTQLFSYLQSEISRDTIKFDRRMINEQNLVNLLYQICSIQQLKRHVTETTLKLEQMSMLYYCQKDLKLQQSYQNQINISESKQLQKEKCIEQTKIAEENMRETIQSIKIKSDHYIQQLTNSIDLTLQNKFNSMNEKNTDLPILPNIFIKFNITGSLIRMLEQGYFYEESTSTQFSSLEITQLEEKIVKENNFILPSLINQKDIFNCRYQVFSVISNSRNSQNKLIQKILNSNRRISTYYTQSTEKKEFSGDVVGILDRQVGKDVMILASSGLDQYTAELNDYNQNNRLDQLKFFIKSYIPQQEDEDNKMSISECAKNSDSIYQLEMIFNSIKKTLITQYLIESSNLSLVVIRDTEQDFALIQQIKLLCSNYIQKRSEKRIFYIIHYYPEVEEQYEKDQLHLKIQSRFNLEQQQNGIENGRIITFKQNEEPSQQGYRNNIPDNIIFNHLLLFGDINSEYNSKVISVIQKQIDNNNSNQIYAGNCKENFANFIQNNMKLFFQKERNYLEFRKRIDDDSYESRMFKDRILYPFNFIS